MVDTMKQVSPATYMLDALLAVGCLIIVVLSPRPSWFLAAYSLIILFAVLLYWSTNVPEAKPGIQLLCTILLLIAAASLTAHTPMNNDFFKSVVTNLFFFSAWFSANEFLRRPFAGNLLQLWGLALSAPEKAKLFEKLTVWPATSALMLLALGIQLPKFWHTFVGEGGEQVALICWWSIPFALNLAILYRVKPEVARRLLREQPNRWCLMSQKTLLFGLVAVSVLGFAFEFLGRHNYLAWTAISGILLLQGLVVFQIQRWASQAMTSSGQTLAEEMTRPIHN